MSNMSYCRFQNTYEDLMDCSKHFDDDNLSVEQLRATKRLVKLYKRIVGCNEGDEE